jgi:hypothetical protein
VQHGCLPLLREHGTQEATAQCSPQERGTQRQTIPFRITDLHIYILISVLPSVCLMAETSKWISIKFGTTGRIMRGAIPQLPKKIFTVWCSIKHRIRLHCMVVRPNITLTSDVQEVQIKLYQFFRNSTKFIHTTNCRPN